MPPKVSLPPLNGLRAFEVSGRHLSFRSAAKELGVTQGAVSQQVRGLEDHLGIRLFFREPRGLVFTEEGRTYHELVTRTFSQIALGTSYLKPSPSKVTISVTPTFAAKWLVPRLSRFTKAFPDIDLRIEATARNLSFRADGIDIAVRQGRSPFGASLSADLLFRDEIIAVCAPTYAPCLNSSVDASWLSHATLLHDTPHLWRHYAELVQGKPPLSSRRLVFSQTSLGIDAAVNGQGVTLASRCLVWAELKTGLLISPDPTTLQTGQDFHVLVARSSTSAAPMAVREWLLNIAQVEKNQVASCPGS